ncbi:MAG: TIGR04002 family protein [Clostridia bacterium]|nr:TIGR04002 family protein [Clostridia bacterium]
MERKKYQEHLKNLVLSALFAAMVYVMTAFVHIPTHQGYVHIGDGIIYLAASLLPAPYAIGSAAVGAGLSDYLSGYPHWVLPTMIIKALTAIVFTSKKETIINKRNLIGIIPAIIICVGGYFVAGTLLKWIAGSELPVALMVSLSDVPSNIIQGVGSAALFVVLGTALDKTGVKRLIATGSISKSKVSAAK